MNTKKWIHESPFATHTIKKEDISVFVWNESLPNKYFCVCLTKPVDGEKWFRVTPEKFQQLIK